MKYNKSSKLEHVAYDIRGPVLEKLCGCEQTEKKILRLVQEIQRGWLYNAR